MNENLELKLQAMLDGQLPPAEARRVRQLAENDPAAGDLLAELRSIKNLIKDNEPKASVPESREFYWSKIARQIQNQQPSRPTRNHPWFLRWRNLIAAASGVGAFAVLLLFALRPPASQVAYNQVPVTADGYEARAFRDQTSGRTFVFLHDTKTPADALPQTARFREDGSSFQIEFE